MNFTGEHLLPGNLGHFFVLLSFVASLIATIAFFRAAVAKTDELHQSWKRLARIAFTIEALSVFAVFALLYLIISNHFFEYKYAWQHSDRSLEVKYLLSCFWEGQEGSFLLWSIWHCVLGLLLIRTSRKWEAPVMTVVSFAQVCLATMLMGLFFFDAKVGSNPFVLLRNEFNLKESMPVLNIAENYRNYLQYITNGNGLNPLLQNYWMVIHPPVLFLGFASTIVPFAFAVAGLWKKNFGEWVKPALPWALFSACILGTGIMMGAAWAYESLTFGGYWAWDPVENASLVPWMVSVCGIHALLAYKHSGHSLRATYLFFILQFLLILYSTFLTRSGILGDTSVHAFTDLGMNFQLLMFIFVFLVPSVVLLVKNYRKIPFVKKEENISSREFWLFVGALLLFLSALFVIGKTSLPVVNKIFGTKFAPPAEVEYSYNKVMIMVAMIIAILTAVTQYLKYKETGPSYLKRLWWPTLVAAALSLLVSATAGIHYNKFGIGYLVAIHAAVFAALYSVVANAMYIWLGLKGKMISAGASIAHVGFGLALLGILISASKKEVISRNTSGIMVNFGPQSNENPAENLTLIKGVPTQMGKYDVTYTGDSIPEGDPKQYFKIHFRSRADEESFTLKPNAFVNYKGNNQLMANPASKHYITKDIFTYITSMPDPEKNKDTAHFVEHTVYPGDTTFYSEGYYVLNEIKNKTARKLIGVKDDELIFAADITVVSKDSTRYKAEPVIVASENPPRIIADTVVSQNLFFVFTGADKEKGIRLAVKESNALLKYVTLKAYTFPMINVLWLGVLVMITGFGIAIYRRARQNLKAT